MVRDLPRLNKKTLEQFQHPRNLSERLAKDERSGSETVGRELRMLIVGYCYGIRSERRLCEETHLNLAYRWFCRLSLEDEIPNHSRFGQSPFRINRRTPNRAIEIGEVMAQVAQIETPITTAQKVLPKIWIPLAWH